MKNTEKEFKEILSKLLSEDFYNYESFLKIVSIDFTDKVETLAVTFGEKPKILVNINFVKEHCVTKEHVKALIFHELLHINLGHNLIFPDDEEKVIIYNIAFDSIINSIIHKIKGEEYSSFMKSFYSKNGDVSLILIPYDENLSTGSIVLDDVWKKLYKSDNVTYKDVINLLENKTKDLNNNIFLIGSHPIGVPYINDSIVKSQTKNEIGKVKNQIPKIKDSLMNKLRSLGINDKNLGIRDNLGNNKNMGYSDDVNDFEKSADKAKAILSWKIKIYKSILRFLEDSKSRVKNSKGDYDFFSPVLNNKDRRSVIKSMWYDSFVFSRWTTIKNIDSKQANVYIDLSGSMTQELPYIISVLFKLKMYIKNPFWAFSNKVEKAKFEGNKLISKTTGGTSIIPVFEHIKEKKAKKTIIITDGYFEIYSDSHYKSIKPKSDILFILVPHSSEDTVKSWGFKYIKIDSLDKLSKR
jgi:hypothetical protein